MEKNIENAMETEGIQGFKEGDVPSLGLLVLSLQHFPRRGPLGNAGLHTPIPRCRETHTHVLRHCYELPLITISITTFIIAIIVTNTIITMTTIITSIPIINLILLLLLLRIIIIILHPWARFQLGIGSFCSLKHALSCKPSHGQLVRSWLHERTPEWGCLYTLFGRLSMQTRNV